MRYQPLGLQANLAGADLGLDLEGPGHHQDFQEGGRLVDPDALVDGQVQGGFRGPNNAVVKETGKTGARKTATTLRT